MARYEWMYWAFGAASLGYVFLKEFLKLSSDSEPASSGEIGAASLFRFQAHLRGSTLDENGLRHHEDGYDVHFSTSLVDIRFPKARTFPFPFLAGDGLCDEFRRLTDEGLEIDREIAVLTPHDVRVALYTKEETVAALLQQGRVLFDAEGLRFIPSGPFPRAEDDPFLEDVVVYHELMTLAKNIAEPGDVIARLRELLQTDQNPTTCAGLAKVWCAWADMGVIRNAAWPAPMADAGSVEGADAVRLFLHLRVAKPDHYGAFLDLSRRLPFPLNAEFLTHIARFTIHQQADLLAAAIVPQGMSDLAFEGALRLPEAFARPLLVSILNAMLNQPRGPKENGFLPPVAAMEGFVPHQSIDAVLLRGVDRGSEPSVFLNGLAELGTVAMVAELAMRRKKVKSRDRARLESAIDRLKSRYGLEDAGNQGALSAIGAPVCSDGGLSPAALADGHLMPATDARGRLSAEDEELQ